MRLQARFSPFVFWSCSAEFRPASAYASGAWVCVCLRPSNTNLFINSSGLPYVVNLETACSPLLSLDLMLTRVDVQAQGLQRIASGSPT